MTVTAYCAHNRSAFKKHVGNFESIRQQSAWIVSEVKDDSISILKFLEGGAELSGGIVRDESRELDVADSVVHELRADGVD